MSTIKIYDNQNTRNEMLPQIFNFEGSQVRIIIDEKNEPWFVARDIAKILGHNSAKDAIRIVDEDERGSHTFSTLGGPQKLTIVNESGLYSLVFASRKPGAKKLKKWVTSDVLPTIRKTGGYGQQIDLYDPKQLRKFLLGFSDKVEALEDRLEANQPKVSFYDDFINADGLYNLQNAARALNLQPNLFINSLKNNYIFYQGNALVPYQHYAAKGLFVVKSNVIDDKMRYQTYITPKGLQYFAERYHYKAS